ncbi:MAG: tyrosine-type recombinase/integrase, partial [Chloroflexota bacterium]|nr:tyrosine-type recombinase/integrase [Chloroflexota bacterium]
YNPHALRHSVASNLLRGGCELMKVARMLGHRNATMVLPVCGHLLPDEHRDASAMMDAMSSRARSDRLLQQGGYLAT